MNQQQVETLKGLTLANEFLKILRSYRLDQNKDNPIPHEVSETLANAQLSYIMEKHELEPEHLVWGLVKMIEMFLTITDTEPEVLSSAIDRFINFVEEQEKNNG